jgi:hypothetical protein
VVWNVRRYRPDVIVVGISGGHGHHQASGILAQEVYSVAADKTRFPEQFRWVEPWQARRLVSGGFGGPGPGRAGGGVQGHSTRRVRSFARFSYGEIRSMHKSQGVGA